MSNFDISMERKEIEFKSQIGEVVFDFFNSSMDDINITEAQMTFDNAIKMFPEKFI